MNKRAIKGCLKIQSAMEYLMTYGWAILIIAVILGAMFQLGVFGSGSGVPSGSCVSATPYLCRNPILSSNGMLTVQSGEIGSSITVTGLGCSNTAGAPATFNSVSMQFTSGGTYNLVFSCTLQTNAVGSPFSGTLWIQYSSGTQSGLIARIGTISAKVTQGSAVALLVAGSITPLDPSISSGQSVTLTASWSGGTLPYSGAWVSGSSATCSADTTVVATYSGTSTTSNSVLVTPPVGTTYYCVNVVDSSPIQQTVTLPSDYVTVIPCFASGTPILTPQGIEQIQNIKVGTIVYSFNSTSNKVGVSKVIRTFTDFSYYTYTLNTSFGKVITTKDHPFYVGNDTFIQAGNLGVGDDVGIYQNNTIIFTKILSINVSYSPQPMYNLEVNNTHTYFAGGFAVHNKP